MVKFFLIDLITHITLSLKIKCWVCDVALSVSRLHHTHARGERRGCMANLVWESE